MTPDFETNKQANQQLVKQLTEKLKKVYLGGGEKKIADQHQKGKLTARERIAALIDTDTEFLEIGAFAGDGMYEEDGGCPSGGVIRNRLFKAASA